MALSTEILKKNKKKQKNPEYLETKAQTFTLSFLQRYAGVQCSLEITNDPNYYYFLDIRVID